MNRVLLSLATLASLAAASAHATPIRLDGAEKNLQQIVDEMTVGGASSIDVVNDQFGLDEGWQISSPIGGTGMILMEIAGHAGVNRLGLYDINDPGNRLQLFGGADGAGAGTQFGIDSAGHVYRNWVDTGLSFASDVFGFYLETPDGTWFSQSGLNADGSDHLVSYRGVGDTVTGPFGPTWDSNLFLLGWEDLASGSWDQDYNDFVLFVQGVDGVSVPEPASLGLLGLGLVGLAATARRKKLARG